MSQMQNSDYRVPHNPGYLGGFQWKPLFIGWGIGLCSQVFATEFLAYRFLQFGLIFDESKIYGYLGPFPIYLPLCWMKWLFHYHRWILRQTPPYTTPMLISMVVGAVGLIIGIANGQPNFNRRAKKLSENNEDLYGTSEWLKRDGLEHAGLLGHTRGLLLGLWREKPGAPLEYLYDDSDRHFLVSAATRTGKTMSVGMANALVWDGSSVVLDIKGELYEKTAGFRQKKGHVCLKFEPFQPDESVRINPLAWIRIGTDKEISDTQKVAEGIAIPASESDDNHWNDTSKALIDGVILHELYKCAVKRKRIATLADISMSLSPFDQTAEKLEESFTNYLKEMVMFPHDPEGKRGWKDQDGKPTKTHPVIRERAMEALQRHPKEATSVLSSAKKRFWLYADPLIRKATGSSAFQTFEDSNIQRPTGGCDFQIEDLVDHIQPVSLYLVVPPPDQKRLGPLIRIILLMILGRLTEKMVARRHKLLLLLDEFPKMGYMSPLEDGPSYLAGYGIRCMFIVQNLSQINDPKRYGPHNEIIPNCHLKLFFTISDYKTAEEVAKEVGPRTIQHASIHFGFKHKNSTRLQPTSAHVQNTKRDLIEPSELERLKLPKKVGDRVVAPGEYILLIFGYQAVKGIQAFCFLDPTFKKWIKIKPVDQSKALIPRALLEAKPATA